MLTVNQVNNPVKIQKKNNRASEDLELAQKLIPEGQSIVYFSDFHSNVSNLPELSGLIQYIQTKLKDEKVFKICSGDFLFGNDARNASIITKFFNKIKLDFLTPGNHEFDTSKDMLAGIFKSFKFPVVLCNLKDNVLKFKSAAILKSHQGKFGAIGITVTSKDDKNWDGFISYEETKEAVQNKVDMLTKAGYNRILLASHLGFEKDKQLARETSGLDIIISAHDHISINGVAEDKNLVRSNLNEPVAIFQAGENNEAPGYARVAFDKNGRLTKIFNKIIPVSSIVGEDRELADLISKEHPDKLLAKLTASANIRDINCNENALANWLADTIKSELQSAQAVILPSRMIRTGLSAGNIREIDIQEMLPVRQDNKIETFKTINLTGRQLINLLQKMTMLENTPKGKQLLHVSGLKYTINSEYKVTNLLIENNKGNFIAVENNKSYLIAVPGYILAGKVKDKAGIEYQDIVIDHRKTAPEIIIEHLKQHPEIINLKKDSRITPDSSIANKFDSFDYPEFIDLANKVAIS